MIAARLAVLPLSSPFPTTKYGLAALTLHRQFASASGAGTLGITPALHTRLQSILKRHQELSEQLCAESLELSSRQRQQLNKEYGNTTPVAEAFQSIVKLHKELTDAEKLWREEEGDAELQQLAGEEMALLQEELSRQRSALLLLLLPRDEDDQRNIIVEVRAGAGGEEAALFAADLVHMYQQYGLISGWRAEVLEVVEAEAGGYKYASLGISGNGVFGRLKFENGVHRVQRVPATEAHGRIHTSTATVAVLPEPDEIDVSIRDDDLRIDTYRSGGAGGQHVNTTDSAVRVTHLPSGIVVTCQDERSQHKNKAKALKILRARLYEAEKQRRDEAAAQERRQAVGTGDRNERIRTYNFPQGRVTDHRVNITEHGLEAVLSGERLDVFIAALHQHHQNEMMQRVSEGTH